MQRLYSTTIILGLSLLGWASSVTNLNAQIYSLITFSNSWRYNQTGSNLGTAWRAIAYDDTNTAGWFSGQSLLGFEDATPYPEPFRTPLTPAASGGPVTVYLRTHFTWPTNIVGASVMLVASNLLDDGAVFYLNGAATDVGRIRVATGQNYQTLATNQASEGIIEVINLSTATLIAGDNVLAVELHQSATNSTDVAFGMSLTGIIDRTGPKLLSASASDTTNTILVTFNQALHSSATNVTFYAITQAFSMNTLTVSNAALSGSNVTLRVTPWMPTNYILTVNRVRDNSATTNIIAPNSQIYVDFFSQIFPMNTEWRYYFGGTPTGGDWKAKAYNDSGWAGPSQAVFAYELEAINACTGQTFENTSLTIGYTTYYFRTHFTSPTNGTARLRLRHVIDDGVVYYLNGVEIHRLRMLAGTITDSTFASGSVGNPTCEIAEFSVTNLLSGDNVIAAEVHQNVTDDNDVIFGLELRAAFTPILPAGSSPTLNLVRGTGAMSNMITLSWVGNGFALESASAIKGPWFEVSNMANPYSTTLSSATTFYRLKK